MDGTEKKKMTIVGTVSNMAPEMINAESQYTEAVDIYSLAVTMWEIQTVLIPFEKYNQFQIYKMVGEKKVRPDIPEDTNPVFRSCMNAAWCQDPKKRPSAAALHVALCKEHDRLNELLVRVKDKWKSNTVNDPGEERNAEFEIPDDLPRAFKLKSASDSLQSNKTSIERGVAPQSSMSSFRRSNLGMKTSPSFGPIAASTSNISDLTEEEQLELITMGDEESQRSLVSVSSWEMQEKSSKSGSFRKITANNPLAADGGRGGRGGGSGGEKKDKRKIGEKLENLSKKVESFRRRRSENIRKLLGKGAGGLRDFQDAQAGGGGTLKRASSEKGLEFRYLSRIKSCRSVS